MGRSLALLGGVAFVAGFGAGGLTVLTLELYPTASQPMAASTAATPSRTIVIPTIAALAIDDAANVADAGSRPGAPAQPSVVPAAAAPAATPPIVPAAIGTATSAAAAAAPEPEPRREVEVRRGDTLLDILARAGIATADAHEAVGSLRKVTNLRRLQVGQKLALELDPAAEGRLQRLVLPLDAATELHLRREADGLFTTESVERPLQRRMVRVEGAVSDSIYAAAKSRGVPQEAIGEMVKLLSWDIDFQRDIHPGDRFETVFAKITNAAGEPVKAGDLLFAGLELRGRTIEAYRYTATDGRTGYYDREGRALRKWLLRTPIDGARLSSRFGMRKHPVLGFNRMHKGIDFAAPPGTPILAAGDGVVDFVGRNKGYGKYVRLRHNGEYSTAYAHMSRFASGMKRGRKVKQGEVIGYVGSTGMSTGPHLHYEVLHRGTQVNPLGIKAEFAERLEGKERQRFLSQRDEIDRLRGSRPSVVAQQ